MIKLVASSDEGVGARVPIRWCISKDVLEELAEKQAVRPHLFVVVTHGGREIERRLIPLDGMMDYFDFHRAGDHKILATILWHKAGDLRKLRAVVHGGRAHGQKHMEYRVLDQEGNLLLPEFYWSLNDIHHLEEEAEELTISVAAGHFANEPSRFEQWWVNLWFHDSPRDQCSFRKRRFLAYSIQPPLALLFVVFITALRACAALGLLLIAKRGINFKAVVRPWNYNTDDVWHKVKYYNAGTFFTKTHDGRDRPDWFFILAPFTPIVGILGFVCGFAANVGMELGYSLLALVAMGVGIQIGLSVIFCLIGAIYLLHAILASSLAEVNRSVRHFFGSRRVQGAFILALLTTVLATVWYFVGLQAALMLLVRILGVVAGIVIMGWIVWRVIDAILSRSSPWNPDEVPSRLARQYRGYEALLCDNRPLKVAIQALPRERQTVYLRFQDFKAKVCKPFALG